MYHAFTSSSNDEKEALMTMTTSEIFYYFTLRLSLYHSYLHTPPLCSSLSSI